MAKFSKMVTIKAPVEKVFAFMGEPHNLPEIWPSMVAVKNVEPAASGGYNFGWTYKMAGMNIEGASDTTVFIANERLETRSTKGIDSHFTWMYEAAGDGTQLTVEVEYIVPIPVLGKLAESIIVKQNEREAELLLDHLKQRMEAETPIAA